MIANGIVDSHKPRIRTEYRGGNVIDFAAKEPAHGHVQFEVHDMYLVAREKWAARNIALSRPRPGRQVVGHHGFARSLLLRFRHAYGGPYGAAQVFHMLH